MSNPPLRYTSILTIAGSDSGGGAGIQADIKTISALGCYATSAITAVTVQNTLGVTAIHEVPPGIVADQVKAVLEDIHPAAVKIGMIPSAAHVLAIAGVLQQYSQLPVVLDPVMIASSGYRLAAEQVTGSMVRHLFPLSAIITPNIDEAAVLTGLHIKNVQQMETAARQLIQTSGCRAVLLKGGHLKGTVMYDLLLEKNGTPVIVQADYIESSNTHGTGCTLASAIAVYLAQGHAMTTAVTQAKIYTTQAINAGKNVQTGAGKGPLNHFADPLPLIPR